MPVGMRPKRGGTSDKAYAAELRLDAIGYWSDGNGLNHYADGGGNQVDCGHMIRFLPGNAGQCSSTSQSTIGGFSIPVLAGPTYYWEVDMIVLAQNGATALGMYLTMGGPATSSFQSWTKYEQQFSGTAGTALNISQQQPSIGVNTGCNSNNISNGENYWVHIQGFAIFTAAGSLTVAQAATANAAAFTVLAGSRIMVHA